MQTRTIAWLAVASALTAGCMHDTDRRAAYEPAPALHERSALNDAQIIGLLDQINRHEIDDGRLAEQRAASPAVRDFADRMARDHGMMQQQAGNLASRLNVIPAAPTFREPLVAQPHTGGQLQQRLGSDFDRAYIQHNIDEHEKALRVLDDIKRDVRNPEVQMLVAQTRPAIEAHLRAAEDLDRRLADVPAPARSDTSVMPSTVAPAPGY
jgi:putative membrane protein